MSSKLERVEMICPYCEKEELKLVEYDEDYAFDVTHYICPSCDSTFCVEEIEGLGSAR